MADPRLLPSVQSLLRAPVDRAQFVAILIERVPAVVTGSIITTIIIRVIVFIRLTSFCIRSLGSAHLHSACERSFIAALPTTSVCSFMKPLLPSRVFRGGV
jgi:hypothetical protein